MNFNIILATLEFKGVISEHEALVLAEHLANATQSSIYSDAQEVVKKFLVAPDVLSAPILAHIGPEQAAEEFRARTLPLMQSFDKTTPVKTVVKKTNGKK